MRVTSAYFDLVMHVQRILEIPWIPPSLTKMCSKLKIIGDQQISHNYQSSHSVWKMFQMLFVCLFLASLGDWHLSDLPI